MNLVLKCMEMSRMSFHHNNNHGIVQSMQPSMLRALRIMLRVYSCTLNTVKTLHINVYSQSVKGVKGYTRVRAREKNISNSYLINILLNKKFSVREKNTLHTLHTLHKHYQLRDLDLYTLNITLNTLHISV